MINKGNALDMPKDAMTLFAKYENTEKSLKWSSNVQDGDFREGDKIMCNRCPLKHEVRERGRGEMLYENTFEPNTGVRRPASTNTIDISYT